VRRKEISENARGNPRCDTGINSILKESIIAELRGKVSLLSHATPIFYGEFYLCKQGFGNHVKGI
jgi:hypothetical protein